MKSKNTTDKKKPTPILLTDEIEKKDNFTS